MAGADVNRRIRSEVWRSDGSSVAIVIDPPKLTPDQKARADAIIIEAIADLAAKTGRHPEDCATLLLIEATERHADAAAYEREAARRGVLAL